MRNINRLQRALSYCTLATWFMTTGICAQDQANVGARKDYVEVAAALASLIQHEMNQEQLPAFSIALVDGSEIVWAQGFGYQDPEHKIPATAHTVYRVGSVSKLFTDIGIMQLVEAGKISLDAPVQKYLPWFEVDARLVPGAASTITVRHLLNQTSGIPTDRIIGASLTVLSSTTSRSPFPRFSVWKPNSC